MQSHAEARLMFKNLSYGNASGSYNVKNLTTALKRQEMAAAFFFSIPGPKLLWQFGELGYDVSIAQNGRTGEKPIHWDYLGQAARWSLRSAYADLINYKTNNSILKTGIPTYNLSGSAKYLKLTNADNTVVVVGNFDVKEQLLSVDFGQSGQWLEWPGGNAMGLTGNTYTKTLGPGEYHIYSRKPLYLR
jgi:1,4-alpha-glucan branching enzyme